MSGYEFCLVCGRVSAELPMVFRGTGWCSENHRRVVKGVGDGSGETGLKESIERYPWEHAAMRMGIGIRGLVGGKTPWTPGLLEYTYSRIFGDRRGNEFFPSHPGPIPDYLRDAWRNWVDGKTPLVVVFNEPVQKIVYNEDPPPLHADADLGVRYRMKRNRNW